MTDGETQQIPASSSPATVETSPSVLQEPAQAYLTEDERDSDMIEQRRDEPTIPLEQAMAELGIQIPAERHWKFTVENASEYGKRGAAARLASLQRKAIESLTGPEPVPNERQALVREQIALARDTLKGDLEPKDRAAMIRSLCALLNEDRILRGEPLPGSMRPTKSKARDNRPPVEPVG